ncbi:MAG: T9SS type A sorting domain-containing protein [Flavobacteriales bacterium]|nr:T9SS type A sorting domain-containing protein [Flavobacteriales bacterium]
MKLSTTHLLFAAATLFAAPAIDAQDQVDIGLHRNGDQLDVHVRPASNFNGIFSSLVFTIRWDRATEATLGAIQQTGAPAYYMPVAKSGAVRQHGTFNYQVYAGFGMTSLQALETAWNAGEEYVVVSIPVSGKGEFELVNDAFTEEPANNADYYVSLGGQDRTGIIYKGLATAEEDGSVSIQPNPNNGRFIFTFATATPVDVTVEVVNALGQSVFNETLREFQGTYRKEMDLTSMSNGVYYLKVKRGEMSSTHKIVYR